MENKYFEHAKIEGARFKDHISITAEMLELNSISFKNEAGEVVFIGKIIGATVDYHDGFKQAFDIELKFPSEVLHTQQILSVCEEFQRYEFEIYS